MAPKIREDESTTKFRKKDEKEQWKGEALKRRMEENRKVSSLTYAQHRALEFLCRARHEMHSGQEAFFLSEDPRYGEFELFIGRDGKGTINQTLQEAGLPPVELSEDIFKIPRDDSFKREDYPTDYEYELAKARAFDKSDQLAERMNKAIEQYLSAIDKEHGTEYRPLGRYRFPKRRHVQEIQFKYRKQAYWRANQVVSAAIVDMTEAKIGACDTWRTLQGYLDANFNKDLYVISINPSGLMLPPSDVVRSLGLTNVQMIEDYQKIEQEIPEIVKTAIHKKDMEKSINDANCNGAAEDEDNDKKKEEPTRRAMDIGI